MNKNVYGFTPNEKRIKIMVDYQNNFESSHSSRNCCVGHGLKFYNIICTKYQLTHSFAFIEGKKINRHNLSDFFRRKKNLYPRYKFKLYSGV